MVLEYHTDLKLDEYLAFIVVRYEYEPGYVRVLGVEIKSLIGEKQEVPREHYYQAYQKVSERVDDWFDEDLQQILLYEGARHGEAC